MSYNRSCLWCHKPFEAKRKDKVYCSSKCRLKRFSIGSDFLLLDTLVPESEVKTKYYAPQDLECVIYLQWFKSGGERFADVYISKNCDIKKVEGKFKKKGIPIRDAGTLKEA